MTEPQLPRVGGGTQYPLSFPQQTLFAIELQSAGTMLGPDYTIYAVLRLKGPVRYELLQSAFDDVIVRQGALRTRIALTPDDEPVQEELPEARRALLFTEETAGEEGIPALIERLAATPVPADELPVIRASLHRIGADDHLLYLGIHHHTCDAAGLFIALSDFARAYETRLEGGRLAPLPIGYGGYALWQAEQTKAHFDEDCAFWQRYLEGLAPYEVKSDFPFQPGPPDKSGAELREPFLEPAVLDALQRFALRHRTTAFVTLLAGFQLALGSRTESEDRLTIAYFDQRDHPATKEMVGLFLRPAAVRLRLERGMTLAQSLPAMTKSVIAAYRRAYVPVHQLVAAYPDALPSLLGQVPPWFFIFQYLPEPDPQGFSFGGARGQLVRSGANLPSAPGMLLRIRRAQDAVLLRLRYDPGLWREASMRGFARSYAGVLSTLLEDPRRTPAELLAAAGAW